MSNDFGFEFDVEEAVQSTGSGGGSDVKWDELNQHVIERAKTADKTRSLKGIISGITDLGIQEQDDFEEDYKDTTEQNERIEKGTAFLREEGGKKIFCSPQKPTMQVAVTIDFPIIMVNKGQYFGGEDNKGEELPLRLLLNGEFYTKAHGKIVGRGFSIKERKYEDGTWAFAKNNMLHKLAEACGQLDEKGYFHKEDIGKLIGKAAQFQTRVWMKPSKKDPSKLYFTEEIRLAGMIPENDDGEIVIPTFDNSILHMVNFKKENKPEWVKQLRVSVKNTIKLATNYEGSAIQKQLEAPTGGDSKPQEANKEPAKEVKKEQPKQEPVKAENNDIDFDDDIPF